MRIKSILYFSFLILTQSSLAATTRNRDAEIPLNSIYKTCALYEQDHIVQSEAYKNANDKEKGQMLVDEFNKRRRICYTKEFANVVGTLVPTLLAAYGAYRYLNAPTVIPAPAELNGPAAPTSRIRPLLWASLAGSSIVGSGYSLYRYFADGSFIPQELKTATALSLAGGSAALSALLYRYVFGPRLGHAAPAVVLGAVGGGAALAAGNVVVHNPAAGFGGIFFVYQLFGSVISDVTFFVQHRIDSLKSIAVNILFPAEGDTIEKVELEYVRLKPYIPEKLQDVLENHFREARTGGSSGGLAGLGLGGGEKSESRSPIQFARNVLAIPTTKLEINYDPKLIEEKLGTYDPKVLMQLKRFAARHAAASTGKTVKKVVAYFQGPPGVGKTRAAENLGAAMGVPYKLLKLGGKTLADIEGDESKPGLLLEAIINAKINGKGAKNLLIFLDELDRALGLTEASGLGESSPYGEDLFGRSRGRSLYASDSAAGVVPFLLAILEPGQKTFYSPYLRCDVDIEDIIFVAAGNVNWEKAIKQSRDKDTALKDRFDFVTFDGYTPEFKLKVVETTIFKELLQTYESSRQPLLAADFSEEEWAEIRAIVLADKEPGFREVIRRLQNLLDDKALCVYYDECINEKQRQKLPPLTPACPLKSSKALNKDILFDTSPFDTCPANATAA